MARRRSLVLSGAKELLRLPRLRAETPAYRRQALRRTGTPFALNPAKRGTVHGFTRNDINMSFSTG